MDRYKYMQLTFDTTTQDIINEYNLTDNANNVKLYISIRKGIYCLPQYGIIKYDRFKKHPKKHVYQPVKFNPGLCAALKNLAVAKHKYDCPRQ